jgi:hypothetical protein
VRALDEDEEPEKRARGWPKGTKSTQSERTPEPKPKRGRGGPRKETQAPRTERAPVQSFEAQPGFFEEEEEVQIEEPDHTSEPTAAVTTGNSTEE